MTDLHTQLTQTLQDALIAQNGFTCNDGNIYMGSGGTINPQQLAHTLLTTPGITIVQLPATTDKTYKRWINFPPNNQQVSYRGVGVTPTDIRQFAAALLTAANEAEKT